MSLARCNDELQSDNLTSSKAREEKADVTSTHSLSVTRILNHSSKGINY
tara:strand:- start:1138 stop:1284 length:147 start_codon:yes stop_codon:yes gene_type:complete